MSSRGNEATDGRQYRGDDRKCDQRFDQRETALLSGGIEWDNLDSSRKPVDAYLIAAHT